MKSNPMLTRRFSLAYLALPLLVGVVSANLHSAPRRDNEQELLARLQSEQNPMKKAKYGVRLGRIKLLEAREAYEKENYEEGQRLLSVYLEHIRNSWSVLQKSGRQAVKQPQGFKELDIALREDIRTLDDLAHRISFMDRDPVLRTSKEIEEIRNKVLKELFPSEKPKGKG